MECKKKICYHDAAIAEDARQRYIRENKTDKRNDRLVCYKCRDCGKWHLGHLRRIAQAALAPKPPKGPTPGELRRAAKRAAEKAERQKFYQDYHNTLVFCQQLTDNEIARMIALGATPRTVQSQQS
jgi:hypothetical protein